MKTYGLLFGLLLLTFLPASAQQAELLKDIYPGTGSSFISHLTQLGEKAIFIATNSGSNYEPWITDGTQAGTMMIKDINPGTASGSSIGTFVVFQNEAYFTADDGVHGRELWKTNGTSEGTRMVVDLYPGSQTSHPGELTIYKNALYFKAITPEYGEELWKTSGDAASTVLVADLVQGTSSSSPYYLFATAEYLYFARSNARGVYRSDGTAAGTGLLYQDVIIGQLDEAFFTEYKNGVYFRGTDIIGPDAKGTQLWRISGNAVQRITSIVSNEAELNPAHLTVAGEKLFFTGEQFPYGNELWIYDGTTAQMVKDINPTGSGNLGGILIEFKGKLIFSAGVASTGVELWVSDGTIAGTKLISDIYQGIISSGLASPIKIDDILYFSADDGSGGEIWQLLNPDVQPTKLTDIPNGGAWGPELVKIGNTFFFSASNAATGTEIWKMNASSLGLDNYKEENPGILIYPNPAWDKFHIKIPDHFVLPSELTIYNARGSKIWSQKVTDRTVLINTSIVKILPGMYLLRIQNGQNYRLSKSLIIK